MKRILFLFILLGLVGFTETEKVRFESNDGKTKLTATDQWKAAGNMKGAEIFISRRNRLSGVPATISVTKDPGLLEGTDLNTYSAGKIFLQTAVLKTSPNVMGETTINGRTYLFFEYEYNNKELMKMRSLVYHTLIGTTGYQFVVTTDSKSFDQNRPFYIEILESLEISK